MFEMNLPLSVRAVIAMSSGFALMLMLMPAFIKIIKRAALCQVIRVDGPKSHNKKEQTATMGGALIWLVSMFCISLFSRIDLPVIQGLLLTMSLFALIGFLDDYYNIKKSDAYALTAKNKFFLQCLAAFVVYLFLIWKEIPISPQIVPLFKNITITLPWPIMCLTVIFLLVGSSNAVNLTDGLDGLVTVPLIIVFFGLAIVAYLSSHQIFASHLSLPWQPLSYELMVCCASLVGILAGFLWFNSHPAEIFMGDVGSLMLGAVMAYIALVLLQVLLWAVMSGLFILEVASVCIQVLYYKKTKKRFFLMAPLHHHFELKGWSETRVIYRFWLISLAFFVLSLITLKVA